ncbi:MAG: ATP-binding protein [Planctomycetes bacterium]|nr:ATP-binding protein [Planctomycetota bacterium]
MKRFINNALQEWKASSRRKPLILRGPRQVGKTYSVVEFGRMNFEQGLAVVDLERNRSWHRVFQGDLSPQQILADLEILLNSRIVPGKTLLFLDEIQSCPRAILALRYFLEECPELHVVAAGSLLEFALQDVSFPVGRVQFMEMNPMSFAEFLWAIRREEAAKVVLSSPSAQPEAIHQLLLEELRRYFFVGGMPESVAAYAQTRSFQDSFWVQAEIAEAYRQDFSKYAPHADKRCLDAVFSAVARSVGQQIKFSRLAEGFSNPTIKKAFELLCQARVIRKVPAANPSGLPLGVSASLKKFKALVVDIGLMQHLCAMPVDVEYARSDLLSIYEGAMAEQFVGQEMAFSQDELCYWAREARGSSAEVDYLAAVAGRICPVEVKSGAAGRLRSLHLLLQTYPNCPEGLVFSTAPFLRLPEQRLAFIPLYYAYSAAGEGPS